jgi:transcriptional regulator MraZ
MGFRGNFEYQLDDRNRVALPPRFREDFANGAILTPGLEHCIEVYTPEGYDSAAAVVDRIPAHTEQGRRLRRAFHGSSFDVQRDSQGRLLLPPKLIEFAGITKDVVVVGADKHLEIWAKPAWDSQEDELQSTRADALEGLPRADDAHSGGAD